MATIVLTTVEAIAPLEIVPMGAPLESFAADDDSAEQGIPSQNMEELSGLRLRTTHSPPLTDPVDEDSSSPESVQTATPNSTQVEEQTPEEVPIPTIIRVLMSLPSWFPKGSLAHRVEEEIKKYNKKHGFDRLKPIQVDTLPEGYPQLAAFLNSNDNFAVFRRFGELSARTLLQAQVDLTDLETQLRELDKKDAADPMMQHRLRGYEDFEGCDDVQRDILSKVQRKLCEYCKWMVAFKPWKAFDNKGKVDLLLKDSQVRALGPARARHHLGLFNWMFNHKPLGEDRDTFIFQVEDFVSVANHSKKGGPLANFLEGYLDRFPESRVKKLLQTDRELSRTTDPHVDHYAPAHFLALVKALSVSVAVILLLVPVFVLFLVPMLRESMAWLVFGFVLAFALAASVLTETETQGLLLGTATYAAVLSAFLGNVMQSTAEKSE